MIKLFRNIRQNLLNEGKTTKYFKYAIGEIVLVVIGILIALQINNWNQERQNRNINNRLLIKIENELQLNINRLTYLIQFENGYENRIKRNDTLLSILTKSVSPNDVDKVIKNLYSENMPNLYISTYEEMKNTGRLYTIDSKELLKAIETYYKLCERESYYILQINDEVRKHLKTNINEGWFKLQQDYYTQGSEFAIKDNTWLFNPTSKEYNGLIRQIGYANYNLKNTKARLESLIKESEKLQVLIKNELSDRKA
ncbi:MAG TPA: hypothetical protein DER05_00565 [Lutibacter sp.]|nr:hypothetical protein [Lutibacter sp.]